MRYDPSTRMLRLVQYLSTARFGVTIDQMQQELGVSRRSVERLRVQIESLFPELTYTEDENRVRWWRLPPRSIPQVPPGNGALATLAALARDLSATGDHARAGDVLEALTCLRTMMPQETLRKAEPDIEALMQAEGVAMQPGPRQKLDREILGWLREAILGFKKIAVQYQPAWAEQPQERVLCPYGVLYGRRAYLIAHIEARAEMRLWRIDRLSNIKLLEAGFAPQEFDLAAYAAQSFGVFQENAENVVLRFSEQAALEAAAWQFHPTQTMEPQADGSLIVRFNCGGMLELSWHLYTWGDTVEVLAPTKLRDLCMRQPAAMSASDA